MRHSTQRTNRFAGVADHRLARKSRCAAPYPVACGARTMDLTVLTRTRSSTSSRRVAIRPAPVAESSSSCGIMGRPRASPPPREVPGDSLDQGPISRCLRRSGSRNHLFGDESCAPPARPNHLPLLRLRRSSGPPRPPIQPLLTNSVAGPLLRFVLRLMYPHKADEAWDEATVSHGLADTRFCRRHRRRNDRGRFNISSPSDASVDQTEAGPATGERHISW